ncbi:hypothetical protein ANCCEY_04055 [Ancylostoma ceylanicum]|nr:hypothetical protein ANCCEY_04055 [Ancylostoma ceylanicum]
MYPDSKPPAPVVKEVEKPVLAPSPEKRESEAAPAAPKKTKGNSDGKSRIKPPAAKGVVKPAKPRGGAGANAKRAAANARRPK